VFAVDAQDALERPNFGFDRPHGIGFGIFYFSLEVPKTVQ
jgi:hypothetical protein